MGRQVERSGARFKNSRNEILKLVFLGGGGHLLDDLQLILADGLEDFLSLEDAAPIEEQHQNADHILDEGLDHFDYVNNRFDRFLDGVDDSLNGLLRKIDH